MITSITITITINIIIVIVITPPAQQRPLARPPPVPEQLGRAANPGAKMPAAAAFCALAAAALARPRAPLPALRAT